MTVSEFSHELVYDKSRETKLMEILGIQSMDDVTIIPWQSPTTPPVDNTCVFVKFYGPLSSLIETGVFEYSDGAYLLYSNVGLSFTLPSDSVLGWAYLINVPR